MANKEKSLTSMCCAAAIFAVLATGYGSSIVGSNSSDMNQMKLSFPNSISIDNQSNENSNINDSSKKAEK